MNRDFLSLISVIAVLSVCGPAVTAEEPQDPALQRRFAADVQPFLTNYCLDCHGKEKQEGKLSLAGYDSVAAVTKNQQIWELVLERLKGKEMPPEDAPKQPKDAERRSAVSWIEALRDDLAKRNAGDPGPVLARRLSNAELDYTIR